MNKSLLKIMLCVCVYLFLNSNIHAQVVQSAKKALSVDMFADLPSAKNSKETTQTVSKKKNKPEPQSTNNNISHQNPNAGYGYAKSYARQLFPVFEGNVTFEEKNIPNKIFVKKGTLIQFLLADSENGFWIVSVNKHILQNISQNKNYQDNIQIKALKKGNSQIVLEFLTHQDGKYKVTKKLRTNVFVE